MFFAWAGSAAPAFDDRSADLVFDQIYPPYIQAISRRFWTPVSVASRAAELFRHAGARRILDVGAGVGKFVLVAAAAAPEVLFVGVEHREHLVEIATARRERADRAALPQEWSGVIPHSNRLEEKCGRVRVRVGVSVRRKRTTRGIALHRAQTQAQAPRGAGAISAF